MSPSIGGDKKGPEKGDLWGDIKESANRTFWVGFHLSEGSSPLCGSSTGGCNMEMHTSPFFNVGNINNSLSGFNHTHKKNMKRGITIVFLWN